jgi:hypothetical protein
MPIKRGGGMCPMKPGNRQFIDMVPIHTKRLLWKMGERFGSSCLSAIAQKGFFFFTKECFCNTFKSYRKEFIVRYLLKSNLDEKRVMK